MRRLIALPIALILILMMAIPASAHGCHPNRNSGTVTIRNDFYQNANSGVYFRTVRGYVDGFASFHVDSRTPSSSWMFLELRRTGSSAMARVGYRFDPDGSIHRYRHLVSPTGTTMFNTVETTNRSFSEVNSSRLGINYVDGAPDSIRFEYSSSSIFQQPLHTSWDAWDLGGGKLGGNTYRWRFDTNHYGSQFFGRLNALAMVNDVHYTTQYGSANAALTRYTNGYSWAAGGVGNGNDVRVYDSWCY